MKVGFLGLGKLGLPVALAIESKGHDICGTDISNITLENIRNKKINYKEIWVDDYLKNTKLQVLDLEGVVRNSDIILVQFKLHMRKNTRALQEYQKKELILIMNI